MFNYILKRFILIIPTILGITFIGFLIIQLAPGNPAVFKIKQVEGAAMQDEMTDKIIAQTKKLYGLDKPIVIRYFIWLKRVVTLNFGKSYRDHEKVITKIKRRLPVTLLLNVISIGLVFMISIPLGIYSGIRKGTKFDRIVTVLLFILYSIPSFWLAILLIMFFGGGEYLDIFPIYGLTSSDFKYMSIFEKSLDLLWHLVLPVFCLTYGGLAYLSRYARQGIIEVISKEYIKTAYAKGLNKKVVILKHALRNSIIPIITLLAFIFPALFGGSIIIENIFSIPGMGQLGFESVLFRDYPVVMAIFTISSFLTLLGFLMSDILYVIVDPRITFENLEK